MIIVCRKWQKDVYFYELLASVDAFTTISLALLGNEGGHSYLSRVEAWRIYNLQQILHSGHSKFQQNNCLWFPLLNINLYVTFYLHVKMKQ